LGKRFTHRDFAYLATFNGASQIRTIKAGRGPLITQASFVHGCGFSVHVKYSQGTLDVIHAHGIRSFQSDMTKQDVDKALGIYEGVKKIMEEMNVNHK
jgi:hypothetical protein